MMIGAENGCLVYSTTGNLHPLHLFSRVLLNFHFCKLPEVQQSPPVVTLPLPPPSPACSHCCLGFQGFVIPSRRPLQPREFNLLLRRIVSGIHRGDQSIVVSEPRHIHWNGFVETFQDKLWVTSLSAVYTNKEVINELVSPDTILLVFNRYS
ncbi:hypothetical protein CDAR_241731 [Caerostris darwini]|uniref:Uncharacterized protein n=1 Tax=Caerostris darwini TaxID=1538125 RepID=A0AAV4VX85_9ARAC|nr:hypothetical protein CDAR_241731 [Caerostris darwini]